MAAERDAHIEELRRRAETAETQAVEQTRVIAEQSHMIEQHDQMIATVKSELERGYSRFRDQLNRELIELRERARNLEDALAAVCKELETRKRRRSFLANWIPRLRAKRRQHLHPVESLPRRSS